MRFAELLDAVEELVDIVRHRLFERRLNPLAGEVQKARQEFNAGLCRPSPPEAILRDILS